MGLVHQLGDIVSDYENEHLPMPKGDGRAALAFLMQQHGLGQSDLPEIAAQSVISEILNGKRQFNLRQIKALCERFNVSAETFLE
jgi:HTH-type transcriptional regulator/antitoxin HigA